MPALRIILLATLGAIVYGLVQDQVTARICVEYFTIGHPRIIESESPTALALAWGVVATWWVGLPLGVLLAVAARAGARPALTWRDLVRGVATLLLVVAAVATLAGVVGHTLASSGSVFLIEPLASRVPKERHVAFLTDLWIHSAAYAAGFLGGPTLALLTWRRRGRPAAAT